MSLAPLRDYQEQGVSWLVESLAAHRAVLLADDAGLGKTRETLVAAERLNTERIIIICPAGARRVWLNEIHKWVPAWDNRVVLVEPGARPSQIQPRLNPLRPLILIIGYDEFSTAKPRIAPLLKLIRWDLMVLDEMHYLKNPSNRTQAIYGHHRRPGLEAQADKVILLSGTPTPNHAGELWQHYRTFWPLSVTTTPQGAQTARSLSLPEFEDRFTRYRDTVFGRQVTGSKNQSVLREALAAVVLRRRKSEVLAELPPLQLQDIPLGPSSSFQTSTVGQLTQAVRSLSDDQLVFVLGNPKTAMVDTTSVASARQDLGLAKVQPTILWVQERMLSTRKLLVFAWHHSVIEGLERGLKEFHPVVITGSTIAKARAEAVESFQTNPNVRVFIGQILAAGTAITLTQASEVAIVEPSWVPGENVQAICRAHRLGQRDSVLASFLYLPQTLDERIMRVFRRKAAEISELQGDDPHADQRQHDLGFDHPGRARDVRSDRPVGRNTGRTGSRAGVTIG